ncbi:MAG: lipocalin family protein [Pelagimonas sp.]|nr:lipocalin family protein [Pelagimonas sp.]
MALVAAALLTACQHPSMELRDQSAPVASQVNVTAARLTGTWYVTSGAGILPGQVLKFTENSLSINGKTTLFKQLGPGRFRFLGREIWVHWMDADNRTAALGAPNGEMFWIMDRGDASGDRLRAAREILEWYGYDLKQMEGS